MADDEAEPERDAEGPEPADEPLEPPSRRAPRPRADKEKAIGLEVARLFGVSPRLLVTRRTQRSEDEEPTESASGPEA